MKDSVWVLKCAPIPIKGEDDWILVRAYALKSDMDSDLSMLMKLLPDWEFDTEEVEYVG